MITTPRKSADNVPDDLTRNVGKPVTAAQVFEYQLLVVQPELVQYRSLKIMHMHRVLGNVIAKFICFTVHDAGFDPAASHPYREATRMVVASVVFGGQLALGIARAAEFSTPDHECFVQQSPLFQIGHQSRGCLIDVHCLFGYFKWQVTVLVPALVIELNEPHAVFGQLAREQTVGRVRTRNKAFGTVQFDNIIRLFRQIHYLRHCRLHTVSHFILLDLRGNLRIAEFLIRQVIQFRKLVEHIAALFPVHSVGIAQVKHRILALAELHTLMHRVEEAVRPQFGIHALPVTDAA
jgi:hypothetical protein